MYLTFDTETTGLFDFKQPADAEGQPRLCSFAAIIQDAKGEEIDRAQWLIKPDGWSIDGTKAGEVNGHTDAELEAEGIPVRDVLGYWTEMISEGMIAAAFNAEFDCKVMRAELRRAGLDDLFEQTPQTCIMRGLKPYQDQGLAMKRGQYVSLADACAFFELDQAEAHKAMSDTEDAAKILRILIRDGNVIPPKVHYAKTKTVSA